MEDDEVIIGVDDKPPEAAKPTAVAPEEGIDALKAKLLEEQARSAAETAARQDAERRAREAAAAAAEAHTGKRESDKAVVDTAIDRLKSEQDLLEDNMAAAASAGDWAAHSKYQRQMSDNSGRLAQLEAGKLKMEEEAKNPPPVVTQITDPVEAIAVTLSPLSAAWVRSHPEYARDQSKLMQMTGAHNLAVGRGLRPDSPEYFRDVETTLGIRQAENPMSEAAVRAEVPPAAAPARRENNGTRVTLTAAEAEMAETLGMTKEDYAKNKMALKAEGRLN